MQSMMFCSSAEARLTINFHSKWPPLLRHGRFCRPNRQKGACHTPACFGAAVSGECGCEQRCRQHCGRGCLSESREKNPSRQIKEASCKTNRHCRRLARSGANFLARFPSLLRIEVQSPPFHFRLEWPLRLQSLTSYGRRLSCSHTTM